MEAFQKILEKSEISPFRKEGVKISKLKLSGKNRVVNRFMSVAKIITSDAGRCDIRETRIRFGVE